MTERIGSGAMGVVYLAEQAAPRRRVALKELAPHLAADDAARARFLREADIAGSLQHPNVVTIYEAFEYDGVPYIAMEYVPRGALRALVGELSPRQVVGVLDAILDALAHAGERGIVHRDLKPENVLVTDDDGVKLVDFGIAKALDEVSGLTPQGEFVGSPEYVSPEQVVGDAATPASDLYAVGVMAFELLTGKVPFADTRRSAFDLLHRKISESAPKLRTLRPELDTGLCEWVDRLLERDPRKRFATARAARAELAALPPPPEDVAPSTPSRFVALPELRAHASVTALVVHAATRPVNIVAALAVGVAAALFAPWPTILVGVGLYLALAVITFFDEAEAARAAG